MPSEENLKAVRITSGSFHHFFGYYDKYQWDPEDRLLVTHRVSFMEHPPRPDDEIEIGRIDSGNGWAYTPLASTRAWCWQQGSMLQWVPGREDRIIHNDRIGDRFISVLRNADGQVERVLPRPIYTISPDGQTALSHNFSRVAVTRPGYGYEGLDDAWHSQLHPAEDGIYRMDLNTGEHELIISLDQIVGIDPDPTMKEVKHWVNHLLFNPTGDRFIFLHRYEKEGGGRITRVFTSDLQGRDLFLSSLEGGSHFIWSDRNHFLIWGRGEEGPAYYMIEDGTDRKKAVGKDLLKRDGHCSVSPDGSWLLTDEYPGRDNFRRLILYDLEEDERIDIGRFYSPPALTGRLRCDLHPRWDRGGKRVVIDSAHEGLRGMYLLDVSGIVGG